MCEALALLCFSVDDTELFFSYSVVTAQCLFFEQEFAGSGQFEADRLVPASLVDAAQRQEMLGKPVILLVAGPIRAMLSRFARLAVKTNTRSRLLSRLITSITSTTVS